MGFGSCITEKRKQPIWEAIKNTNIDGLLKGEMYTQKNYGVLKFTSESISISLKDLEGETIIYKEI